MPCEMCGKEVPLKTAVVEGNKMRVCDDCAKFGEVVEKPASGSKKGTPSGSSSPTPSPPKPKPSRGPKKRRDVYSRNQKVLVTDYGARIRKARQKKGLTPEELGEQINEKKSVISHTEVQDHRPSDKLVKKLERALDVTLLEKPQHEEMAQKSSRKGGAGPVTLGDLLKEQMDEDS